MGKKVFDGDFLSGLLEPFDSKDIEWRIQSKGWKGERPWAVVLAYVTNRAIQSRLDEVCGPFNWKNEYSSGPNGGIICGLSIYDPEKKEWVTKWDGADNTDIDAVKGGLSNSMKRAGAQWGIGRYLYKLDAGFAECSLDKQPGWSYVYDKAAKKGFYWKAPTLPSWALPKIDLEAGSGDWDKVVSAIKDGKRTLEQAMQKYKISKANQDEILRLIRGE